MAGGSAGDWCLIESDPGVFSELIRGFGVQGVQVEELWSLDPDRLKQLKPVHGLIFLFKWKSNDEPSGSVVQDSRLDRIFFAKQVISNACATQAILSILLNCSHNDLQLGQSLMQFKEFSEGLDPPMKGLCLSNMEDIRLVHNSFARQNMFEFDNSAVKKDEDAFHFVAYMPIEGRLYELDGLKDGPVDLGLIPKDTDWLDLVRPVLERRINKYSDDEIHFNLMAIVTDRKQVYEKRLNELNSQLEDTGMETEDIAREVSELNMLIRQEEEKIRKYKIENIRRRHNYLPFIVELFKILAKEGQLVSLYEKAKQKAAEKSSKEKTNVVSN